MVRLGIVFPWASTLLTTHVKSFLVASWGRNGHHSMDTQSIHTAKSCKIYMFIIFSNQTFVAKKQTGQVFLSLQANACTNCYAVLALPSAKNANKNGDLNGFMLIVSWASCLLPVQLVPETESIKHCGAIQRTELLPIRFFPTSLCGVLVFGCVPSGSSASASSASSAASSFHTHLCHLFHTPSFTHIFVAHPLSHTSLSHTIFHTHLCHTPSFTHIFVAHPLSHTSLSHTIFHTHLCHTPSFTHIFVTHHLSHTSLSHTIFHTHLCHTPSFAHIFVTHHLSHTSLSHTIFRTHLCHTPSFAHIFATHHLSHTSLSHTIFHTHLCHTPSFTHIFVTHHLSHTSLSHTIFHTWLCHTPSFTHIFVTHTTLHVQPFNSSILHRLLCLSFLPPSCWNFLFVLIEEVDVWGYPVL